MFLDICSGRMVLVKLPFGILPCLAAKLLEEQLKAFSGLYKPGPLHSLIICRLLNFFSTLPKRWFSSFLMQQKLMVLLIGSSQYPGPGIFSFSGLLNRFLPVSVAECLEASEQVDCSMGSWKLALMSLGFNLASLDFRQVLSGRLWCSQKCLDLQKVFCYSVYSCSSQLFRLAKLFINIFIITPTFNHNLSPLPTLFLRASSSFQLH